MARTEREGGVDRCSVVLTTAVTSSSQAEQRGCRRAITMRAVTTPLPTPASVKFEKQWGTSACVVPLLGHWCVCPQPGRPHTGVLHPLMLARERWRDHFLQAVRLRTGCGDEKSAVW